MSAGDDLNRCLQAIYLELPGTVADDVVAKVRARENELMVALGYFLNGEAYDSTFPNDDQDGKQLRKAATWNRITARNLLSEKDQFECGERMKAHIVQQPEWQAIEASLRAQLSR